MKFSSRKVIRISLYALLSTAIIYVSVVLVAIGQGYSYNWRTGELHGGGLVFIDSRPAAQVEVDGQPTGSSSPQRLRLDAGLHKIKLSRDGFSGWQKNVSVATSGVARLQYARLLPEQLRPFRVASLPGRSSWQLSPDRQLLALLSQGSKPRISIVEAPQDKPSILYQLASNRVRIRSIEWAPDSRHLLVTLEANTRLTHLIIDRENPTERFIIENELKVKPGRGLSFSRSDWQELYWLEGGVLRSLNLGSKTVAIRARRVKSYLSSEAGLFALQTDARGAKVSRLSVDDPPQVIIDSLRGDAYKLKLIDYGEERLLMVLDRAKELVSFYDPASESQQSVGRFDTVKASDVTLSPQQRFLVMRNGDQFATYDFDARKLYRFEIKNLNSGLSWLDEFHLLGRVNSTLVVFEFDGANRRPLGQSPSGLLLPADADGDSVYIFEPGAARSTLQRLPLR